MRRVEAKNHRAGVARGAIASTVARLRETRSLPQLPPTDTHIQYRQRINAGTHGNPPHEPRDGGDLPADHTLDDWHARIGDGQGNGTLPLISSQAATPPHPGQPHQATAHLQNNNNVLPDDELNELQDDNTPARNLIADRLRAHTAHRTPIKKKTAATIRIATWNMRGRYTGATDKWHHINQIIKDNRYGVLCLQETHLANDDTQQLNNLFRRRLEIIASPLPGRETTTAGVAIVLNREITNVKGFKTHEIIPGRALLVRLPWHTTKIITILNVYAPNAPADNAKFWLDLAEN